MSRELVALVLGAALAGFTVHGCSERAIGRLEAERNHARQDAKHWEQEAGRVDTVFRVDTVRLALTRRVTDSILVRDSLIRTDTVRILLAAERQACDQAISTCELRVQARDSIIAAKNREITALVKQRPGWLERAGGKLLWAGIGFGIGAAVK